MQFEFTNLFTHSDLVLLIVIFGIITVAIAVAFIIYIYILQKRIETLKAINTSKSYFINRLSYELRRPLFVVDGFCEMLNGGTFGELNIRQRERIRDIYKSGQQIRTMLEDVRGLAGFKPNGEELEFSAVKLKEIISYSLEFVKNEIRQNSVNIVCHITLGNMELNVDRLKIFFVVKHVISNAVRFSKAGGQVTITDEMTDDRFVNIIIADSGEGIPKERLEGITDYPDEAQMQTKSSHNLGLPMSRLFLELHGGSIKVESQYELGTTVIISLPI